MWSLVEANQAFSKVEKPSHYTWNGILEAHTKFGRGDIALQLYSIMQLEGTKPNNFTFPSVLKACVNTGSMEQGKCLHDHIIECGFQYDTVVGNALISMYSKGGSLQEAKEVFAKLPHKNVVTWAAMVTGYAENGKGIEAMQCFEFMQHNGVSPSKVTFLGMLKACNDVGCIEKGRYIHAQVIENGFKSDIVVGNTLVNMYAKLGGLEEAYDIFNNLPNQDVVAWSAMVEGYARHDEGHLALEWFDKMKQNGVKPDKVVFFSALKSASILNDLVYGRQIHEQVNENGFQADNAIGNTLVHMYAKCGSLQEAQRGFAKLQDQNEVSWAMMIAIHADDGQGHLALQCYEEMQNRGINPGRITYLSIIKACSSICAKEHGKHVHEQIIESSLQFDIIVGCALIDMYAKCGCLASARGTFDNLTNRDLVVWGAMIAGYAEYGECLRALDCFQDMQSENIKPNKIILISMLKACGNVGAVHEGRHFHDRVISCEFESDSIVGNSLIDMYSKCGSITEANQVFDNLPSRSVVSWGAMIVGYAQLGAAKLCLQCFENLKCSGVGPNDVIFTGILSAFSHAGLVDEGLHYFTIMREEYELQMRVCHVTCMMDLLGHAGCFVEAEKLLAFSKRADICYWLSLLSACSMHCNVNLGVQCFKEIVCLDAYCAAAYVLMSNMYANVWMKEHSNSMKSQRIMHYLGRQKERNC